MGRFPPQAVTREAVMGVCMNAVHARIKTQELVFPDQTRMNQRSVCVCEFA